MMQVTLEPDIAPRLRKAVRKAGSREIGGMLFAEQLAPARFKIVDFSTDQFSGSHTSFRRDPIAHQEAMDAFFKKTGRDFSRFNYLGEWHSHPTFSVRPSMDDMQTMADIVEDRTSQISFALLLIVRLRFMYWLDYSMTSFVRGYAPQPARLFRQIHWI